MISIICITKTVFICIFTGYYKLFILGCCYDLSDLLIYFTNIYMKLPSSCGTCRADNLLQPGDNKPPEAGTGEW